MNTPIDLTNTPGKAALDAASALVIGASMIGYIPVIVAILGGIWYAYQMYDLWDRRKQREALRKKRRKS